MYINREELKWLERWSIDMQSDQSGQFYEKSKRCRYLLHIIITLSGNIIIT